MTPRTFDKQPDCWHPIDYTLSHMYAYGNRLLRSMPINYWYRLKSLPDLIEGGSKVIKSVLMAIIILPLVFALGCDQIGELRKTSSSASPEILRTAELGSEWHMNQIRIKVEADDELSILLKLTYGDKVDGYFYLEKGESVNFNITGDSPLYELKAEGASEQVTSGRFSFIASQAQGTTYTLTFHNTTDNGITIFLELIYPITASIYVPVNTQ